MKYLLACLLAVSCGVNAKAPYQGFCDDTANFAGQAMSARQMNTPIKDVIAIIDTYEDQNTIDLYKALTRLAYTNPVFESYEDSQYTVDQFSTAAFEECDASKLGDNSP